MPALNDLLEPYGIAFGDSVVQVRGPWPEGPRLLHLLLLLGLGYWAF